MLIFGINSQLLGSASVNFSKKSSACLRPVFGLSSAFNRQLTAGEGVQRNESYGFLYFADTETILIFVARNDEFQPERWQSG